MKDNILMKNNELKNLQTRREFFKKAAKGTLPIIAGLSLAGCETFLTSFGNRLSSYGSGGGYSGGSYSGGGGDDDGGSSGCGYTCSHSCSGGCDGSCQWGCETTCRGSCEGTSLIKCYSK